MEKELNNAIKKWSEDLTIKELERDNKKLSNENRFGDIVICVLIILIIVSSILSHTDFNKYYYIAPKTQIVELTHSDIVAYCYEDDGLDELSFKGKYDGEYALVTIDLVYTEYDTLSNGRTLYKLDIYAISTIKTNSFYSAFSEEVDTIYTSHY